MLARRIIKATPASATSAATKAACDYLEHEDGSGAGWAGRGSYWGVLGVRARGGPSRGRRPTEGNIHIPSPSCIVGRARAIPRDAPMMIGVGRGARAPRLTRASGGGGGVSGPSSGRARVALAPVSLTQIWPICCISRRRKINLLVTPTRPATAVAQQPKESSASV